MWEQTSASSHGCKRGESPSGGQGLGGQSVRNITEAQADGIDLITTRAPDAV